MCVSLCVCVIIQSWKVTGRRENWSGEKKQEEEGRRKFTFGLSAIPIFEQGIPPPLHKHTHTHNTHTSFQGKKLHLIRFQSTFQSFAGITSALNESKPDWVGFHNFEKACKNAKERRRNSHTHTHPSLVGKCAKNKKYNPDRPTPPQKWEATGETEHTERKRHTSTYTLPYLEMPSVCVFVCVSLSLNSHNCTHRQHCGQMKVHCTQQS